MDKNSQLFYGLIYSLVEGAMMGMGKVQNPATNRIERNLAVASVQIEMLRMMKEKTNGNLTKDEEKFLFDTLSTLELNYAEEVEKDRKSTESESTKSEQPDVAEQSKKQENVKRDESASASPDKSEQPDEAEPSKKQEKEKTDESAPESSENADK